MYLQYESISEVFFTMATESTYEQKAARSSHGPDRPWLCCVSLAKKERFSGQKTRTLDLLACWVLPLNGKQTKKKGSLVKSNGPSGKCCVTLDGKVGFSGARDDARTHTVLNKHLPTPYTPPPTPTPTPILV